jgi:hypothetical protein
VCVVKDYGYLCYRLRLLTWEEGQLETIAMLFQLSNI